MKSLSQRSFSSMGYDGVTSWANLIIKNASYLDTGYYSCYLWDDENEVVHRQFIYIEGN